MRIKLIGFRCHVDKEITINGVGGIHRIRGPSGAGKSTIFAAMHWVLYGSMQHVYNNTGVTTKCSVTLEFDAPKIVIYRQKKPELLKITITDPVTKTVGSLEDQVAQQFINSTFGTKEVWQACCYISQNARSYLLTASNADKMELLNTLSFSADNPDIFISRIETELGKIQTEFTSKQAIYGSDSDRYNKDINTHTLDTSLFVAPEERQSILDEIAALKILHKQLTVDLAEQQKNKGIVSSLQQNQNSIMSTLTTLPPIDLSLIPDYEVELEALTRKSLMIPVLHQLTQLRTELSSVDKKLADLDASNVSISQNQWKVTDADVAAAALQQKQYDDSTQLCKSLNCLYDSAKIAEERASITAMLEIQPRLQALTQMSQLEASLKGMQGPTSTDEEIQQARDKLNRLQASVSILKCPHCTKPIRNINGKLMPGESDPASPAEISAAQTTLTTVTAQRKRGLEIESLQRQLETLRKTIGTHTLPVDGGSQKALSSTEIVKLRGRIDSLGRIQITTPPPNHPTLLRQILSYQNTRLQLENRKKEVTKQLTQVESNAASTELSTIDAGSIPKRINELKGLITSIHKSDEKKRLLEKQLDDVIARLNGITIDETVTSRLEEAGSRLKQLQHQIDTCTKVDALMTRQVALEEQRVQVEKLFKELTTLQKAKTVALEEECHALQATVDSINIALSEIVTHLFDDPISISLQLFKTLKTKDRIKPSVNLAISYKGGDYDNISQLSGGEGDRVSLALTLALARLNTCPLLLLDECLSSLDSTLKESCLKILRKSLCQTKTVMVILHDTIEGHYDSSVDC